MDAIRAGRGDVSLADLMDEHGIESEEVQQTRKLLRDLPSTDISEEDLRRIDDRVSSEITTVTSSHPGRNIYYLPDAEGVPDEYQRIRLEDQRTKEVMKTLVDENESWFWSTSVGNVDDWLTELDDELQGQVASCLYGHIQSRQRFSSRDSPSPEEQFRRTSLWPILKDSAEDIMGFLRRSDNPQSIGVIAEEVEVSENTVRTILRVLDSAEPVSGGSSTEVWQPV